MHPIVLDSTVTVGGGEKLAPSSEIALRNAFDEPLLVDAVRMMTTSLRLGEEIRVRFDLDEFQVSDFTPIPLYFASSHNFWIPDTPIHVRAHGRLVPQFWNTNEFGDGSQTIRVTYLARKMPKNHRRDSKVKLPWVCSYIGTGRDGGANSTENSKSTQLCNPFSTPVSVRRFTGRVAANYNSVWNGTDEISDLNFRDVTTRMFDHQRRFVVRDPTPFGVLFSNNDWTWPVSAILPPHGYYTAQVDTLLSSYSSGRSSLLYPMIGMIAEREVTL